MPLRAEQTSLQPQPRLKSRPQAIKLISHSINLELGSRLTSEPSRTQTQSLPSTPNLIQF